MDKVLLVDDERIDLVDVNRLQSFSEEGVANGVGGTLSVGSGTFTQIGFTGTWDAALLGQAQLYYAELVGNNERIVGRVLKHDPTIAEQAVLSTLDFSVWSGQSPWIWARRKLVDTDFETRRKWVTLTSSEETFNLYTIERELVEWSIALADPGGGGWFKVGYVSSAGGPLQLPTVFWVHPFDASLGYDGSDSGGPNPTTTGRVGALWELGDPIYLTGGGVLGVGKVLSQVVTLIAQLRNVDDPYEDFWFNAPLMGMKQVDGRLDALEADQQGKETKGLQVILGAVVELSGGGIDTPYAEYYGPAGGGIDLAKIKDGHSRVTCPGHVKAVGATIRTTGGATPAEVAAIVTVGPVAYDGVANESTFDVWTYDVPTTALANYNYYLVAHGDPTP